MSGAITEPRIFRPRLVDSITGQKVFAYACGQTICADARFQGRVVDTVNGRKVFAIASECRHPPTGSTITWVKKDCNPPHGLPSILLVRFSIVTVNECWLSACPKAYLYWDGASWLGTIPLMSGSLDLEFECDVTFPTSPFRLSVTGCATATIPIIETCDIPFQGGNEIPFPALDAACCDGEPQTSDTVAIEVLGVTLDRYVGRLVDSRNGIKVFEIGECCPDPNACLVEETCCGCDVSPRQWTFTVAGVTNGTCVVCTNFNATWTITYQGACIWEETESAGICTPGTPWQLLCDGTDWILRTSSFGGSAAVYKLAVGSWSCFGPNTMTKTSDHGACNTFPATITITAV